MSPLTTRDASPSDAPALADLLAHLGYPVAPADLPARMARFVTIGNGRVLVATIDGSIAGFAAIDLTCPIHHAAPVMHISAFAVSPAARRKGVGRALLVAVERAARDKGCRRMVVTSAEPRADAHQFYTAAGWAYTGRRFGKEVGP
jgi:GNAT superfamily N-acetyltransferase